MDDEHATLRRLCKIRAEKGVLDASRTGEFERRRVHFAGLDLDRQARCYWIRVTLGYEQLTDFGLRTLAFCFLACNYRDFVRSYQGTIIFGKCVELKFTIFN